MIEEVWAEIEGYPDYAVSNHGRVRNVRLGNELQPRVNSYGYVRVSLRRDGETHDHYVHHLVARAFVTGYYPGVRIEHHDDNNSNNYIENLRFLNGRGLGTLVRHIPRPIHRKVQIVETGMVFRNVEDCARYLGGDPSSIYRVLRGERRSHKGYTYQYHEGHNG